MRIESSGLRAENLVLRRPVVAHAVLAPANLGACNCFALLRSSSEELVFKARRLVVSLNSRPRVKKKGGTWKLPEVERRPDEVPVVA